MSSGRRTDCERYHRRDFLKVGSAGFLGLTLSNLLRSEARAAESAAPPLDAKAKNVILVWLAGGPATIDMWDLRPDAPAGVRGEFKEIPTKAAGINISEHLPQMATVMDRCTIVRSIHHTVAAHGPGTVYMTTGNKPTPAVNYPSLGSLTARLLPVPTGVPPYVTFSNQRNGAGGSGYLGTGFNPFEVEAAADTGKGGKPGTGKIVRIRGLSLPEGITLDQLDNRNQLLEDLDAGFRAQDAGGDLSAGMDRFHRQALEILRSDKTKNAFDLSKESTAIRERYGKDNLASAALTARKLVEAGVRFVTISLGGWDTHGQNFNALKTRLLPSLDTTLSALIQDLSDRGLLDSTIVYCAGEFGRTPKINGNSGRDHWARSMAVVLAGGGFKAGYAHGTTEKDGSAPATEACSPDDVSATIFRNLGVSHKSELVTPSGRPIQLFREAHVLDQLRT